MILAYRASTPFRPASAGRDVRAARPTERIYRDGGTAQPACADYAAGMRWLDVEGRLWREAVPAGRASNVPGVTS